MTDLEILKDGWGEPSPPSPDARLAARAALMRQIAGGTRRAARPRVRGLRLGWLLGGAATTAALVAAVAFSLLPGAAPTQTPTEVGPGRDLLLAAAAVAESQPETAGTYWHVSTSAEEYWTTHDGGMYRPSGSGAGGTYLPSGSGVVGTGGAGLGFEVAAERLTLTELQQLPTDADALTAWVADSVTAWGRPDVAADTAYELTRLLWRVPTPPAVRAAAFRALADLSNVTRLADQGGNWVLRIAFAELPPADKFGGVLPEGAGSLTVVIHPATSQLVSITNFQGIEEIRLAEWTDDLPPIVELPAEPTGGPSPSVSE